MNQMREAMLNGAERVLAQMRIPGVGVGKYNNDPEPEIVYIKGKPYCRVFLEYGIKEDICDNELPEAVSRVSSKSVIITYDDDLYDSVSDLVWVMFCVEVNLGVLLDV